MECAIKLKNVTKTFGSVVANKDVSLEIRKGEILALLGENGSGKTTLLNMIAGIYYPDSGEVLVNGKPVEIRSPKDAYRLGIGMIHQHFKLIDVFTATENIALGLEKNEKFDLKEVRKKAQAICEKYHFDMDFDQKVYSMSVSQKQTLEIIKVLYRGADILILDEPTAVLTPQEIDELMGIMKELAKEGKSILFITHKLNEIMAVADRCTVLRKGKYIGTVDVKNTTKEQLSEMMVGRNVKFSVDKAASAPKEVVLEVENLHVKSRIHKKDAVSGVSFDVRAGEIVCIAGIDGNGQTELVYGITGLEKVE